jgi:GxxExxY protein
MSHDRAAIELRLRQAIDSAMRVHTALGPGLLEGAYEACLAHGLRWRGIAVRTQVTLPVRYRDATMDIGYRIDLLVDELVILELKSVTRLLPVHEAQLLSYLKHSGHRAGLLINFHVPRLKDGIRRMVNGL